MQTTEMTWAWFTFNDLRWLSGFLLFTLMPFSPELHVQLSVVPRAHGAGWLLVLGLMNNGMAALKAKDDSADQSWGRGPSFPTPNISFILWCQVLDYPHAGPVNSSPYKQRVHSKVYCKATVTPSSLADLCADHRMNSNWLWSPAWGHSEILHSLTGSLQSHSVCEGIWEFPSSLPLSLSTLTFLSFLC